MELLDSITRRKASERDSDGHSQHVCYRLEKVSLPVPFKGIGVRSLVDLAYLEAANLSSALVDPPLGTCRNETFQKHNSSG